MSGVEVSGKKETSRDRGKKDKKPVGAYKHDAVGLTKILQNTHARRRLVNAFGKGVLNWIETNFKELYDEASFTPQLPRKLIAMWPKKSFFVMPTRVLDSTFSYNTRRQAIAKLKNRFIPLTTSKEQIPIEYQGGTFFCETFCPPGSEVFAQEEVHFYVPGTAFRGYNEEICSTIAMHLAISMNATVVVLIHPLSPESRFPWPLQAIANAIRKITSEYPDHKLSFSGYSSGAYLITLAIMYLRAHQFNEPIESIIQFFPLESFEQDLSGIDYNDQENSEFMRYLEQLGVQVDDLKDSMPKIQEAASRDKIFKPNDLSEMAYWFFKNPSNISISEVRTLSLLWYPPELLRKLNLPPVTIITGENDFFRPQAYLFSKLLRLSGNASRTIVIPGRDHQYMWDSLLPVYLATLRAGKPASGIITDRVGDIFLAHEVFLSKELVGEFEVLMNSFRVGEKAPEDFFSMKSYIECVNWEKEITDLCANDNPNSNQNPNIEETVELNVNPYRREHTEMTRVSLRMPFRRNEKSEELVISQQMKLILGKLSRFSPYCEGFFIRGFQELYCEIAKSLLGLDGVIKYSNLNNRECKKLSILVSSTFDFWGKNNDAFKGHTDTGTNIRTIESDVRSKNDGMIMDKVFYQQLSIAFMRFQLISKLKIIRHYIKIYEQEMMNVLSGNVTLTQSSGKILLRDETGAIDREINRIIGREMKESCIDDALSSALCYSSIVGFLILLREYAEFQIDCFDEVHGLTLR